MSLVGRNSAPDQSARWVHGAPLSVEVDIRCPAVPFVMAIVLVALWSDSVYKRPG